jgi:hypothetical protein
VAVIVGALAVAFAAAFVVAGRTGQTGGPRPGIEPGEREAAVGAPAEMDHGGGGGGEAASAETPSAAQEPAVEETTTRPHRERRGRRGMRGASGGMDSPPTDDSTMGASMSGLIDTL